MRQTLRQRVRSEESGFTLVELLVVIVIIALLAAIAITQLLGQRAKAQDAVAKADIGNAVSLIEPCYAEKRTYAGCRNEINSPANVDVTANANSYTITATSTSGNTFSVTKDGGTSTRACTVSGGDRGGCYPGDTW